MSPNKNEGGEGVFWGPLPCMRVMASSFLSASCHLSQAFALITRFPFHPFPLLPPVQYNPLHGPLGRGPHRQEEAQPAQPPRARARCLRALKKGASSVLGKVIGGVIPLLLIGVLTAYWPFLKQSQE